MKDTILKFVESLGECPRKQLYLLGALQTLSITLIFTSLFSNTWIHVQSGTDNAAQTYGIFESCFLVSLSVHLSFLSIEGVK